MARAALAAGLAAALLAAGALSARDLPFFAVQEVRISGLEGERAREVRRALREAALDMSTLRIREDALRAAVRPYAEVADLRVETDLPHALRIEVLGRTPVAVVDGRAVAGDGRVLDGVRPTGLPEVAGSPGNPRTVVLVRLLAAAPSDLRSRIRAARLAPDGPEIDLRQGPELRFGDAFRPVAKWRAAAAVLADPRARGATYLDLRLPERPAAGGLVPSSPG